MGVNTAILRIHGAAPNANDAAQEGLRRLRRPGRHHHAAAFITCRNAQADSARRGLHRLWRQRRAHCRRRHARISRDRIHLSTGEHHAQIGRINRRRFHPHHDIVRTQRWQVGFD